MPIHDKVFRGSICFILGVFIASVLVISPISVIWYTSPTVILFVWSVIANSKKGIRIILFFLLMALGYGYYYFDNSRFGATNIDFGSEQSFEATISRNPSEKLEFNEIVVTMSQKNNANILVRIPRYPDFDYGDKLSVTGSILSPKPENYANYLLKERIVGVMYYPHIELVSRDKGSTIRKYLYSVKNSFMDNYEKVMKSDHSALMSGLTLGEQAGFEPQLKEAMKNSGTLHIVALSGYNISILAWIIARTLGSFLRRKTAFITTTLAIIGFVIMTGAEASVVRAGIMGLLILIADQSGRLYSMKNALAITALLMILFNPKILVFDIGFQLSFAALLGIVYLKPSIQKLFLYFQKPGILNWRENFLTTTSAQLAVIPILLHSFGSFSLIAPISNILVLETVPVAMGIGFVTGLFGFISYNISMLFGLLSGAIMSYQIFIIEITSDLSHYLLINKSISIFLMVIYYSAILGFIYYVKRKTQKYV